MRRKFLVLVFAMTLGMNLDTLAASIDGPGGALLESVRECNFDCNNVSSVSTLEEEVEVIEKEESVEVSNTDISMGRSLGMFKLTGYHARTGALTASGAPVQRNHTISVDKRVIPLGTWVWINIPGDGWQKFKAEDTGSAVKGNIIDIYVGTRRADCFQAKYNSTVEVRLAR